MYMNFVDVIYQPWCGRGEEGGEEIEAEGDVFTGTQGLAVVM